MPQKHKLRTARDNAGLTQKQLNQQSGVSASTISHIECHRGPDVPKSELRTTKTKLSTAVKLIAALAELEAGEYTVEEFLKIQKRLPKQLRLFTESEFYEALVNEQERAARRKSRRGRHLRSVA